jgi:CHASE2 domain-containing sensor protein
MKKILTHWIFSVIILAVLMAWGFNDPFVKQTARLKSFDLIQKYDVPTVSQDVAIVEIDERAIAQYGQWPWKRDVIADIIGRLREAGAGVIVLRRRGSTITINEQWCCCSTGRNHADKSKCSAKRCC